jgi:hypothetical protein
MDTFDDAHFNDLIARMTALQQQNVEEMREALRTNTLRMEQVSQENLILCDSISCLKRIVETKNENLSYPCKEPKLSMPEKFDGTRSKFCGFANQVRLFIKVQLHRFSTQISQVGLVGTLLSDNALSWFGPLNEQNSFLLENFEAFMEEFSPTFGDIDKARMADSKIRALRQGSRPTSAYAYEFRQFACDVDWASDMALVRQFHWGLIPKALWRTKMSFVVLGRYL